MAGRSPNAPLRKLLLVAAMAAGIITSLAVLRSVYPRILAGQWQGQLRTVPDDQARVLLGKLGALGEPGIPVLVEALGSERESVAGAAKQVLSEQLDLWTTLPPQEVPAKLAILADSLAENVDRFGPTARRDAEDLAARLLRWHPDGEVVDLLRMIASCQKVLEATGFRSAGPAEESQPDRLADASRAGRRTGVAAPSAIAESFLPDRAPPSSSGIADLAPLPGGGLPVDTLPDGASPPARLDPAQAADARVAGRGQPAESPLVKLQPAERYGLLRPLNPTDAAPSPRGERSGAGPGSAADSEAPERSGGSDEFVRSNTLELMRRLATSCGDAAARIRAELERRGFTELHLALAARLFDPDPAVRVELARRLPELQDIDAVPWLLWLSQDRDSEVRLAAVTLLATTGDPTLLRRVQRLAQSDPDARVRQQADRIAQRHGGAWR